VKDQNLEKIILFHLLFDPRLIRNVSAAVAEAAMKSGVAQKKIEDFSAYKDSLAARLDPSVGFFTKYLCSS
jgi:malate dehydrogenase (oxaloacetate-decarboxylating)(NADP+)